MLFFDLTKCNLELTFFRIRCQSAQIKRNMISHEKISPKLYCVIIKSLTITLVPKSPYDLYNHLLLHTIPIHNNISDSRNNTQPYIRLPPFKNLFTPSVYSI